MFLYELVPHLLKPSLLNFLPYFSYFNTRCYYESNQTEAHPFSLTDFSTQELIYSVCVIEFVISIFEKSISLSFSLKQQKQQEQHKSNSRWSGPLAPLAQLEQDLDLTLSRNRKSENLDVAVRAMNRASFETDSSISERYSASVTSKNSQAVNDIA